MKNRISRIYRNPVPEAPLEFPVCAHARVSGVVSNLVKRGRGWIANGWKWLIEQQQTRSRARRLQLEETISLGQKRFVALIRVDGQRLLVGGGATEVALLARLDASEPFSTLLKETAATPIAPAPKRTRKRTAKSKVEPERCA